MPSLSGHITKVPFLWMRFEMRQMTAATAFWKIGPTSAASRWGLDQVCTTPGGTDIGWAEYGNEIGIFCLKLGQFGQATVVATCKVNHLEYHPKCPDNVFVLFVEKTGARGKRGACDAWTEQVREPHLNNTHTHTLKTLTHFHPLYVRSTSSSGFSRY